MFIKEKHQQNNFSPIVFVSFVIISMCTVLNAQWGPDTRLTYATGSSYTSESDHSKNIICIGDTLHIVWSDNRPGWPNDYGIYYKRSSDEGQTWTNDTLVSTLTGDSQKYPCITTSNSNIYLVWNNTYPGQIRFTCSNDGGRTWLQDTSLTDGYYPIIAASGSYIHMVWPEGHNVFYKRSTDNGLTWSVDTQLTSVPSGFRDDFPGVDVSGSYVYVIWYRYNELFPESTECFIKRSTNNGSSFLSEVKLSMGFDPRITCIDSIVYVKSGGYLRRSTDYGQTWTCSTSHYTCTRMIANDSFVNIIGGDYFSPLYYYQFENYGTILTVDTTLVGGYVNCYPHIAASGSAVYIIWSRSDEIYYKTNPTANYVFESDKRIFNNNAIRIPSPCKYFSVAEYYLPTTSFVEITLFDLMGKKISTSGLLLKPKGIHRFIFQDLKNKPAGIYFLEIKTEKDNSINKFVFLK